MKQALSGASAYDGDAHRCLMDTTTSTTFPEGRPTRGEFQCPACRTHKARFVRAPSHIRRGEWLVAPCLSSPRSIGRCLVALDGPPIPVSICQLYLARVFARVCRGSSFRHVECDTNARDDVCATSWTCSCVLRRRGRRWPRRRSPVRRAQD